LGGANLLAEVVDGEAEAFLEIYARLPAKVFARAPVVERDSIHVTFT
jgi:hypothetical protein